MQTEALRAYAQQHGLALAGATQEIISGRYLKRQGLNEVLAAAQAGKMDVLLIRDFERISRGADCFALFHFIEELGDSGVEVKLASGS